MDNFQTLCPRKSAGYAKAFNYYFPLIDQSRPRGNSVDTQFLLHCTEVAPFAAFARAHIRKFEFLRVNRAICENAEY